MIITKTERLYKEAKKAWFKHGNHDRELTHQTVKRTTIYFIFFPVCWWEKIVSTDLLLYME
jgi:hypothetical protein